MKVKIDRPENLLSALCLVSDVFFRLNGRPPQSMDEVDLRGLSDGEAAFANDFNRLWDATLDMMRTQSDLYEKVEEHFEPMEEVLQFRVAEAVREFLTTLNVRGILATITTEPVKLVPMKLSEINCGMWHNPENLDMDWDSLDAAMIRETTFEVGCVSDATAESKTYLIDGRDVYEGGIIFGLRALRDAMTLASAAAKAAGGNTHFVFRAVQR